MEADYHLREGDFNWHPLPPDKTTFGGRYERDRFRFPMFLLETPDAENILACWFPLLYTGFMSMGIAYSLQIIGQKSMEPSRAALIMSLESVFAVLFGWLFLDELLSVHETVGCTLMMAAIL